MTISIKKWLNLNEVEPRLKVRRSMEEDFARNSWMNPSI
jgi:hypothetical protein